MNKQYEINIDNVKLFKEIIIKLESYENPPHNQYYFCNDEYLHIRVYS